MGRYYYKQIKRMNNKLMCSLCRKPHNEPKMCPTCSEIFCSQCIRNYLQQKYFCPCCDTYIIEMMDCTRLIDELKDKIQYSQSSQHLATFQQYAICLEHAKQIKYLCLECELSICSDCALIETIHKQHRIETISSQPHSYSTVNAHYQQIIEQYITRIDEELEKTNGLYDKQVLEKQLLLSEFKYFTNCIKEHYENIICEKQMQINKTILTIEEDISEYEDIINKYKQIKKQLQNISKIDDQSIEINRNKKVVPFKKLFQKIENQLEEYSLQQNSKQIFEFATHTKFSLNLNKSIAPEFVNFVYEMEYTSNKDEFLIFSEVYESYGYFWRMKIYPSGNNGSGQYFSLFLELVDKPINETNHDIKFYYRLELLSLKSAGQSISKEYCSIFTPGQCWGYSNFIEKNQLADYLHDGKLYLTMGIHHQNYYNLSQNMKTYVKNVEKEKHVLENLIKQMDDCRLSEKHNKHWKRMMVLEDQDSSLSRIVDSD